MTNKVLLMFLALLFLPFVQAMTFEELVASYGFSYPEGYVAPDFEALVPEKETPSSPLSDLFIIRHSINYSGNTLSFSIGNKGVPAYNYAVHIITPESMVQRNILYTKEREETSLNISLAEDPSFIILSLDTYDAVEESNESDNIFSFNLSELPFPYEDPWPEDGLNLSNSTVNDSFLPALNSSEGSLEKDEILYEQPEEQGFYVAVMPEDEQKKIHALTPQLQPETEPVPEQEAVFSADSFPMVHAPEREESLTSSFPELTGMVIADMKPEGKDISLVAVSAVLLFFLAALSLTMVAKFME